MRRIGQRMLEVVSRDRFPSCRQTQSPEQTMRDLHKSAVGKPEFFADMLSRGNWDTNCTDIALAHKFPLFMVGKRSC